MKNMIFKTFTTTEIKYLKSCDFAFFGWEGNGDFSYWTYMTAYKEGAEVIYDKMINSINHAVVDSLVYPFCFLHRHSMELSLKYLYNKYMCSNDVDKKQMLEANHRLQDLWDKMEPTLTKNVNRFGSCVDLKFLRQCVLDMQKFDEKSMQMRYPVDKNLNQQNHETRLDYKHVHSTMIKFAAVIERLDHDIENSANFNYSQSDRTEFYKKYLKSKKNLEELLKKAEIEKNKPNTNDFTDILKLSDFDKFYDSLDVDDKIMSSILYYGARTVENKEINLSVAKSKRTNEFIDLCMYLMKKFHCDFGQSSDPQEDIMEKQPSMIYKYISTAIAIMEKSQK